MTVVSNTVDRLHTLLDDEKYDEINPLLADCHPAEIAHILESLPIKQRRIVWSSTALEQGDILSHLNDAVRTELMQTMHPTEVAAATEEMEADDAADLLQDLPGQVIEEVLLAMDEQHRWRLAQVLFYPEDTAGGLMNTDTLTIRADVTLDVVLRYLRLHAELPERTDTLMVVDRDNYYQGVLLITDLLTHDPELEVQQLLLSKIEPIPAHLSTHEVARLFEQRDLVSAPVIDEEGLLLGRITVDDVVDVIRAEADHTIMSSAGLDEEDDMFAPALTTTRHRAIWLGINLLTAFLAAWVIGLFEATLEQIVALAVLMPVVASMGGIAGSQTLTVVIRGMALGKVTDSNTPWLLRRELFVSIINGILWALVVAGIAILWFGDIQLGIVIGCAIVVNLLFAAFSGTLIPLLLKRLSIDPALAGGVILTTVTDVVGFAAFLGLATLFLL